MAKIYIKSPNGTSYNMTIVTSGVSDARDGLYGWSKLPNGLIIQWRHENVSNSMLFNIEFNNMLVSAFACETDASGGWAGTNQSFTVFGLSDLDHDYTAKTDCYIRHLSGHMPNSGVWMSETPPLNAIWTFIGY